MIVSIVPLDAIKILILRENALPNQVKQSSDNTIRSWQLNNINQYNAIEKKMSAYLCKHKQMFG